MWQKIADWTLWQQVVAGLVVAAIIWCVSKAAQNLRRRTANNRSDSITLPDQAALTTAPTDTRSPDGDTSLGTITARRKAMEAHFFELEKYIQQLEGRKATWAGVVDDIQKAGRTNYIMHIESADSPRLGPIAISAEHIESCRTLRKGDRVRVSGTLRAQVNGRSVILDLSEIEILR